ncbi:MAG: endolytic transglycosylase MltG [Alphaproteobacteria bacterium]|nr:endolytic transglycosylase MltG [Alphaproteobacteria bacterium]
MGFRESRGESSSRQRGASAKSIILFFGLLAVLAALSLGAGGYFAWREAQRPGPLTEDKIILLKSGSSVRAIANELGKEGAVRYPPLFIAAVRVKGDQGKIKAGEYNIPARASVLDIVDILVEGKSILHYLTAPEGLTTAQILRIVAADSTLVGDITLSPGEGELLPETYAFTRGETRDELIRTMMKAQDKLLDELWDNRALDLPYSTRKEAIILASIVEKETGVADERPHIASVFINRLKKGMRLESDPTIIYGLTKGEPLGRGLRVSEIHKATPYNTYIINGLPPTPICNPGRASIEAALNPANTDDLFFVADGTGGHVFSSNIADHNRNVAKWRRVEKAEENAGSAGGASPK